MYESDDEQSKREYCYHESNNNKNNDIINDDSVLFKVCCLEKPRSLCHYRKTSDLGILCTNLAYGLGPYCQDLGLIFSRDDHTLG